MPGWTSSSRPLRRLGDAVRRGGDVDPTEIEALSDRELRRRYHRLDARIDLDDDPDARAAEHDLLAAEVLKRRPDLSTFWYDRGMYAKWRGDWEACAAFSRRALELIPSERRAEAPAAWNLGIAATALGDWASAREAWAAYGLSLPEVASADEPIVADFGLAPVRLNAEPRFVGQRPVEVDGQEHDVEVVWGRRLCPARLRILNVPTPDSGHQYGDIVLHDGDTLGTRRWGGREFGVFNEIALWQASPTPTLTVTVTAPAPADAEDLMTRLDAADVPAEDWTRGLRMLCRACSDGAPGDHDHGPDGAGWSPERTLGVAALASSALGILGGWAESAPGRAFTVPH